MLVLCQQVQHDPPTHLLRFEFIFRLICLSWRRVAALFVLNKDIQSDRQASVALSSLNINAMTPADVQIQRYEHQKAQVLSDLEHALKRQADLQVLAKFVTVSGFAPDHPLFPPPLSIPSFNLWYLCLIHRACHVPVQPSLSRTLQAA